MLASLVVIGFQTIQGTQFDSEVSDLTSLLTRARTYAMSNNTYVFVGLTETDASVSASTTPQVTGNGRLGVAIVASNDGTKGYSPSTSMSLTALTVSGSMTMTIVAPARHFENVHLLASSGIANLPNSGSGSTYNIYSTSSVTTFQWPLTGTAQYSYGPKPGSVIQFNPQGEAQIIPDTSSDSILQWIEIDLQPTHGNSVPTVTNNTAAILIVGTSGAVTLYRK